MSQATNGTQGANALIWIDLEMTGLNPETDRIIEVATIITDNHLNIIAEGPVFAVRQSNAVLDAMDDWNKRTHAHTGLIERVKASTLSELDAEHLALEFIQKHVAKNKSPMCGSSVTLLSGMSRGLMRGSYSNTSRPAPAITPFSSASASASSSMISPRAVLTR